MEKEIKEFIGELEKDAPGITELFQLYEKEFAESPAAVRHHHNYKGGLLEHTLGVLKNCRILKDLDEYEGADLKVLYYSAILHDVGKLKVYRMNGDQPEWLPMINLVDHISFSALIFMHLIDTEVIYMTPLQVYNTLHCILSHHGRKEWGSPVVPFTVEAKILHRADYLNAMENNL